MFTGIIEAIGKITKRDRSTIWIQTPFKRLRLGESISIEGVCLTVSKIKGKTAAFDIGPETARITTLGKLPAGEPVNLERELRVGDRLGGHWVSGHVESLGRVRSLKRDGKNYWLTVDIPAPFRRFVIPKGSIAVSGVSLTVVARRGSRCTIMLVPHTLKHTTLADRKPGDAVNLETDLLAKYALGTMP